MITEKTHARKPSLTCLILLISFPSFAAVFISPALPVIGTYFAISGNLAQQLITVFIIGYAFGQLIYSPFANRFGRKITIYIGVSIFILSCLVCMFSIYFHSINLMIWCRFFMALGSAVGMVISFTIISDVYSSKEARVIVSYTILAYAFVPAIAIAFGGFITSHFSWIVCFYFYIAYGIFIFYTSSLLPETLTEKNHHALKIKPLIQGYLSAFSNKRLLIFSSIYGLMASFIYIIASGAPFIGIDRIGLSPAAYGSILLIPYCGQFVGSLAAGKLNTRLSTYQVLFLGYASTILGSVLMFLGFTLGWVNSLTLFTPMVFIMMGLPMTYSIVTVMALAEYPDKASGSAIMSFVTMFTALIFSFILTLLPVQDPLMMPGLLVIICIIAILIFWYAKRCYPSDAT